MSIPHPAAPQREVIRSSQTVLGPAGPRLNAGEAAAFLEWLRLEAQESALRAALKRYGPRPL